MLHVIKMYKRLLKKIYIIGYFHFYDYISFKTIKIHIVKSQIYLIETLYFLLFCYIIVNTYLYPKYFFILCLVL